MPKSDLTTINDILFSAKLILEFSGKLSFPEFEKDIKTQFAIIRCFEIMGEAANRISKEFQEKYASIPIKNLTGMRNVLIHGYDVVDVSVLWKTIKQDVEPLITIIEAINNSP